MIAAARPGAELKVPLYLLPFAFRADAPVPVLQAVASLVDVAPAEQRVVFAVGGDYAAESGGFTHRPQHHFSVLDPAPVVRESHAASLKGREVHKLPALAAFGDGCVWKHLDDGVAAYDFKLLLEILRTVRHGVQVRHCADRGESSVRGGPGPREYGLLGRESGFAQVHVDVGEASGDQESAHVDGSRARAEREAPAPSENPAVAQQYVGAVALQENIIVHIWTGKKTDSLAKLPGNRVNMSRNNGNCA